ncbi:Pls/PosA family non-ribosomal peptide synthetase [Streptomyces sp. NPDC001970]
MTGKSAEVLAAHPVGITNAAGDRYDDRYDGEAAGTERLLAGVLAGVVGTGEVPLDSHFFHDIGADSLVMAQFCARVRKQADVPPVSMKDVYRHPTIRSLAAALTAEAPVPAQSPAQAPPGPSAGPPASSPAALPAEPPDRLSAPVPSRAEVSQAVDMAGNAAVRTRRYVVCGVLQLVLFLSYSFLAAFAATEGYAWVAAGTDAAGIYLRSVVFGGVGLLGLCTLPVLAKWILVGRWRQDAQIPVWSMDYLRFWLVKTLIRTSPMRLFTASPLYALYLRALGAKVGRGVAIFSTHVPVCTDLLTIGDHAVIRKDVLFSCYRAEAGVIRTGRITLGRDVLVSEQTVLDIDTSMGDRAQLGHASSLHEGQAVPTDGRWHGCPAQPADVDYRTPALTGTGCSTLRKALYTVVQLLALLVVYLPLTTGAMSVLLGALPQPMAFLNAEAAAFTSPTFYLGALAASFVVFFGAVFAGLLVVVTVPRVLNPAIKPDTVYPLYGFHYGLQRAITFLTNRRFFTWLFGDSSAIVHYLRCLGYDLSRLEQTGSNFGSQVKHDSPYLTKVGSGTMVADGLSVINADFSHTSFRMSRTSIGPRSFLGNNIAYPAGARTGDNCLLATKVMVPIDGPVREGVGLLGSPSFEIPRTVMRDNRFDHLESGSELHRRLAGKNRHNATTAVLYLLARWIHFFVLTLIARAAADLYPALGAPVVALAGVLGLLFTVLHFALIERAVTGFAALKPLYCSIYEPSFWRHERFWKMASSQYVQVFNGTPFKNLVWRMLGARIGKRVFDDGCSLIERTLTAIGDDCTLNAGTVIQCHSQEDGAFKSDRTTLGAGCTLGVGAFVHYGVTIGDGAQLACDSFLMKGEEVPAHAHWGANPARHLREATPAALPVQIRPGRACDHEPSPRG